MAGNSKSGRRPIDIAGQKFKSLTALSRVGTRPDGGGSLWLCRCVCRREIVVAKGVLGVQNSCGCIRSKREPKHGLTGTPTYNSWVAMKARCLNPNIENYAYYGGRGICVCERWMDFQNFLADMGIRPAGTSLDRINPNLSYYQENCRWATQEVQTKNKRKPVYRYKARPELLKRGVYF